MNLKTYVENLNKFLDENPELSEMEVVYSEDEEGYDARPVEFLPTAVSYLDYGFVYIDSNEAANAVCIN